MRTLLTLSLMLMAATASAASPDRAAYDQVLAKAKDAQQQAATVGGEWRDVGKMIKESESAAAKGDYPKAVELASEALAQSELGRDQAIAERDAGFPSYIQR